MIEKTKTGAIIATGNGIEVYRLALLVSGLKLEIECPGMKMSRHISALKAAKQVTRLKTNDKVKQLAEVERLLNEAKSKTAYVSDASDMNNPNPETNSGK